MRGVNVSSVKSPIKNTVVNVYGENVTVKSGLMLALYGKDFKNLPTTNTWLDKSGNGYNATASNFAYTTASGSDNSRGVVFDSIDDFLLTTAFANTTDMTFEVKLNLPNTGNSYMVLDWRTVGGVGLAPIYIYSNGQIQYFNGAASYLSNAGMFKFDGNWHTISIKGNGSIVKITVDNSTSQSFAGSMGSVQASTALRIGARYNGQFPLNGNVQYIRLYSRMLSDSESAQNFNASR